MPERKSAVSGAPETKRTAIDKDWMTTDKPQIRMIVCDIDETLLMPEAKAVSHTNRTAIRDAKKQGIIVTLATGRMYATAKARVDELCIDAPVIASNGADIRVGHRTLMQHLMRDDDVKKAVELAVKLGARKYLFCGDDIFCMPEDRDEALYNKWSNGNANALPVRYEDDIQSLLNSAHGRTNKVLIWSPDEAGYPKLLARFQRFAPRLQVVSGQAGNVELSSGGVTKGAALADVCRMLGVPLSEVMAIGDNGNDVELLREAGLGVAVGNATPEAREAADVIVGACASNGVSEAIRRFALPER